MINFAHTRKLRKLQRERDEMRREHKRKLAGVTGNKRLELLSMCGDEYSMIEEEISECLSDHIRKLAERYDVSLPKFEEGEYWERMRMTGDRLIFTTLGREIVREKIVKEQKHNRESRAFILSFIATVGSLTIAVLTICLRK